MSPRARIIPKVHDLVDHLPPFLQTPTLWIKKTALSSSIYLLSLYGSAVEDYIYNALMFRANNPKAYADKITRDVLGQVFPPLFHPEFNQFVSIDTTLWIERLTALSQMYPQSTRMLEQLQQTPEEFLNHEIDAVVYVHSAQIREKWIEIKLFTCPDQSAKVLENHLQPKNLKEYFTTNDYMGLMGFSLIYTAENTPFPYRVRNAADFPEITGSWMIHLLFLDQEVLADHRSTHERAQWLLTQIQADLDEQTQKLGLNKYNCFFKMTENFVKVVKMAQIVEEFKAELKEKDALLQKERLEKEKERLEKEKERLEKEKQRQLRIKVEKEVTELKKRLAKYESPN